MKISLGFSPCPNDTFIFDALVHNKIDTGEYEFEVCMEDVETLNQRALQGELMMSKLSFHAGFAADDKYVLLPAGAAMGFGCGPLLIASKEIAQSEIHRASIALPGRYTTAMLMFSYAFPQASRVKQMIFSDIEQAILLGHADAGVIIHENRFTYEKKGLKKIKDLGEYWEQKTGLPLPLGGIFIRKDISCGNYMALSELIRQSLQYALKNPEGAMPFVLAHAGIADTNVVKKHISTYVNDYSLNIGPKGQQAIKILREVYLSLNKNLFH